MNIYGLFLDDERNPEDVFWLKYPDNMQWKVVRNEEDFAYELNRIWAWELISFDHDLGISGFSGYDALKMLVNKLIDDCGNISASIVMPELAFHTQNPVGLDNMTQYYRNFCNNFHVYTRKFPFSYM